MPFIYIHKPTPEGTTFRLIVTAGPGFKDWDYFYRHMDDALKRKVTEKANIEIVHRDCTRWAEHMGAPPSADHMAKRYGLLYNYTVTHVRANRRRYGKAAEHLRDAVMREYGHALIAFWNKKDPQTKNMITLAKKKGLLVHVVYVNY